MHPPARARALIRRLGTEPPERLLDEARQLGDPGQEARALLRIAADERLAPALVATAAGDAALRLQRIDRPSARAEAIVDLFSKATLLDLDPAARGRVVAAFVAAAVSLPDGPWLHDALAVVVGTGDARVLERAAAAGLGPVCRQFVAAHGGLERLADPRMRAHCGDLDAVWQSGDPEVARVVAWASDTDPEAFAASADGCDAATRVVAYTLAGARLDRDGGAGRNHLERAAGLLPDVPASERGRLARKLNAARERAGLPPVAVDAPLSSEHPAPVPFPARPRSGRDVLGLVDGSEGRLGLVHLRAAARAAPLCVAFDLDLGLYGFPIRDLEAFVKTAEAETRIGDGAAHLRSLHRQGRVVTGEVWEGTVVATTPRPDPQKRGDLPTGRVVLLIGLGHNGLPRRYLDGAAVHYEITGAEVSLETATAMGILADRLARRRSA